MAMDQVWIARSLPSWKPWSELACKRWLDQKVRC